MKSISIGFAALALCFSAFAGKLEKKLLKAVLEGDTVRVESLLAKGADPNHTIGQNESMLICATERGFYDVAQVLIDHGAEINHQTKNGENALMRAVKFGRYQVAKDLISQGIDMSTIPNRASSPLHHAVTRLDFSMVRLLLENHANVNQKNSQGHTPLHLAATFQNPLFIETLLMSNPEIDVQDNLGNTPLYLAVENNLIDVTKRLLQYGADPSIPNHKGKTPKDIIAAWNTDMAALLTNPANLKHQAITKPPILNLEAAKQFAKNGHQVNDVSNSGATILFYAVEHGDLESVLFLIEKGAQINKANNEGVTPLMVAIINGRAAVTELLLDRGANPNTLSNNGYSALYLAGYRQDKHLAQALMNHGGFQVAKYFEESIELPPKLMRYQRLKQQVNWLPNLLKASYTLREHAKPPVTTNYPHALDLKGEGGTKVTLPVFLKRIRPEYPPAGIKHGITGYVVIEAVLTKTGEIREMQVLRTLGKGRYGFEAAAIESLSQWQFKPGEYEGEPVDVRMKLKLDFVLQHRGVSRYGR